MERTEVKINTISEQLGLSWAGERLETPSAPSAGPDPLRASFLQSWPASCTSVWMTSTGSVWRIQIPCWTRAPLCSTCGPPGRAGEPRVSPGRPGSVRVEPVDSCAAADVFLLVETLCTALKNIDRADIVTALEAAQPTACSSEEGACCLSNRNSTLLSPSIINGKHTSITGARGSLSTDHLIVLVHQVNVSTSAPTC